METRTGHRMGLPSVRSWNVWAIFSVIVISFVVVSAASFNGFYEKWGMRDDEERFSLVEMLDETAHRPFVYRRLLPDAANGAAAALPEKVVIQLEAEFRSKIGNKIERLGAAQDSRYTVRYMIVYLASYLCLLVGLVVMGVYLAGIFGGFPAILSTFGFGLLLPSILSKGGYFYDLSELALLSISILVSSSRYALILPIVAAVGVYNKESFLFFIPTLLPLLSAAVGFRRALVTTALSLTAGAGVYALMIWRFQGNEGAAAEHHLVENFWFYINPLNLFRIEWTYGLPAFKGYSFVTLFLIVAVVRAGWRGLSLPMQRHALIAAGINLPLLFLFCAPGESRNLSLLYPALMMLMASSLAPKLGGVSLFETGNAAARRP